MKLGIDIAQQQMTWEVLRGRVLWAEDAGFDGVWLFDHFKALYADPRGPCFEAWTSLAALAALTSRVRFGTLVTGMTHRHPSILATQAVTVDHLSGGRLELAVGAAWNESEHRQLGLHFPPARERGRRLEEGLEVMKALMTADDVTYRGRHYRLEGATYRPRPIQQPHPPLWVGARGESVMLPVVGRHADVWHAYYEPHAFDRKWSIVAESAAVAGRDPDSILKATNLSISEDLGRVERRAEELVKRNFDYAIVSWPGQGEARIEEFLSRIAPLLTG